MSSQTNRTDGSEELSILAYHENRMNGIQSARAQIPLLESEHRKAPKNAAIKGALDEANDMTPEIDYLCTAPNILHQYMLANSDEDKMRLEQQYFKEALKCEAPSCFLAKWKRLRSKGKSRERGDTCPHCQAKNTLFHDHAEGQTSCQACGHAFSDGLSTELKDLGYNERRNQNTSRKLCPRKRKARSYEEEAVDTSALATTDESDETAFESSTNADHVSQSKSATAAVNKYKYECRSYMMERLAQVQAKETIKVSHEDMRKIQQGLTKYRHAGVDGWTCQEMKSFLSKCHLSHLYKHTNYLICWLSKKPRMAIPKEVEKLLIDAFDQMAPHVEKYKSMLSDYRTPERKSKPHYGYVCRQLLTLMGQRHLIDAFPQLISTEKVRMYDDFWKKICDAMDWEFHSSPR